ncbi:MAG: sulfite exporter TauE/SafE family protein [Anaerolineae bacterium]
MASLALTLATLAGAGFVAGILGALLGLGGGVFLVPVLTVFLDLPIRAAVGASLVGVIATSAGVAWLATGKRGADIKLAMRLEVATTGGAILGSLLAGWMSPVALHLLFAAIVFFLAGYTLYRARRRISAEGGESLFRTDYVPHHWFAGMSLSLIAGALSGLLGVGGGFIKVPVMYGIMGVPLGVATATSNFMVGITASASFFVYYGRGDIYPVLAVPTALGVFAGALTGARLAPRLRAAWIRTALILLLLFIGVQMLWKGLSL